MQSFTDKTGAAWDIELTVGTARKIKSRLGIDIENAVTFDTKENPQDASALEKIAKDFILLFDIIFILCENQCRERNITGDQFADLFNGDTIVKATDALLEEIINFSRPARRKVLRKLNEISKEYSEKAGEKLEAILQTPDFRQQVESQIENVLTPSSINSQESSE